MQTTSPATFARTATYGGAIANAMEARRPFSWIKDHDVQAGVYLRYGQQHFQTYELPRRLNAAAGHEAAQAQARAYGF